MVESLFLFVLSANAFAVLGTLFSILVPERRIWPPLQRDSWQLWATWICLTIGLFGVPAIGILDWNSTPFLPPIRFMIGIPLTLLGLFLGTWGMITLSFHQSLGLKGKLVTRGLYRYSRNPQYVCFILFYLGLMVMANSSMVYATGALVILMFALAPFSEEPWLREQYGEEYREYLMRVPRYLGSGFNEVKREDKRTRAHV